MILGIEVGGTHTDAVCLRGAQILSSAKTVTGQDLVGSILEVVERLRIEPGGVQRVVLSTTLSTNAIVERKYARTGMICSAGPGIDPRSLFLDDTFHLVQGAIDHRGNEYVPLDRDEVLGAARRLRDAGCSGVGVVSKFSVRNPAHETAIASLIRDDFRHVCLGHTMSGSLNFPRRLHTTYFNTAVMPVQERFVSAVNEALERLGIQSPIFFLKADGGTYTAAAAGRVPVETILSGPAASMMGAVALCSAPGLCAFVLDVGGTTTDIGILVNGIPILERAGVDICGVRTLVRGLKVISVGAGGDSCVCVEQGELRVGPNRNGVPACMGGPSPTPMDACSVLGEFDQGDARTAAQTLTPLAGALNVDVPEVGRQIVRCMVNTIRDRAMAFLDEVNSHPVYTIHEMLHPDVVRPEKVILIGGPAAILKPYIAEAFGVPCEVPEHAMVANALGAALARTTAQITLHADTQMGRLFCPELHMEQEAPRTMGMEDLKARGLAAIRDNAALLGLTDGSEAYVTEEQCFTMVRGFSTVGRNMRVRIQTMPGVLGEWRQP
jgi:N-methylhydantoinase A/oxoprolinase/acetone carboxylase beta subunit